MEKFTERPAVGTRVTLRKVFWDVWNPSCNGKSGEVTEHPQDDGYVIARFDDGTQDTGLWTSLEPEAAPAVAATPEPAPEIILNGHRYVLAPEQEPEKVEEKREPKRGEIWRDGSVLYLITQARGHSTAHTLKHGQIYDWDSPFGGSPFDYAYPSLAAAIEAGETFK